MSHPSTCAICGVCAAELYSFHALIHGKERVGGDMYDCKACGVRYIQHFTEDGRWSKRELTTMTPGEYAKKMMLKQLQAMVGVRGYK